MNRMIIDFVNQVLIDFDGASVNEYRLTILEKEMMIRAIGVVPEEYLPEVMEANIIGIDFEYDEIVLYEDILLPPDCMEYPVEALVEYDSFQIENAKDAREMLESAEAIDEDLADNMADGVINQVADDIINIMRGK